MYKGIFFCLFQCQQPISTSTWENGQWKQGQSSDYCAGKTGWTLATEDRKRRFTKYQWMSFKRKLVTVSFRAGGKETPCNHCLHACPSLCVFVSWWVRPPVHTSLHLSLLPCYPFVFILTRAISARRSFQQPEVACPFSIFNLNAFFDWFWPIHFWTI